GSGATTVILAIRLDRADIRAGHSDPTRTRVTQAAKTPALSPPLAPRRPHSTTLHGITISDDYAWLKDANWQDVLRDPKLLEGDIRAYLEAENAYTDTLLGHTGGLQKKLVAEMRGRVKEDDSSVPSPDGPYAYFRKFLEGGEHEMFGRKPRGGGADEIVLDGDEVGNASSYSRYGGAKHSCDHRLVAWSADVQGSEYFTIFVREWDGCRDHPDRIEDT